jgi:chromosome segregation ATPase
MSKSTKTNTSSSASKLADLREELIETQDALKEAQDKVQELESRLKSSIDVSQYVSPGDFAQLTLPVNFADHPTRESLLNASEAAQDEISAADTLLGLWRWIASEEGLRPLLAQEIGKTSGIDSPLGETLQAIRKGTKAFAASSKKSSQAAANRRAAAAEKRAAELEAKLEALLSGKLGDL